MEAMDKPSIYIYVYVCARACIDVMLTIIYTIQSIFRVVVCVKCKIKSSKKNSLSKLALQKTNNNNLLCKHNYHKYMFKNTQHKIQVILKNKPDYAWIQSSL